MSYIYLQEQGEESSAEFFSDIPASVLSRLSLTANKSSYNAKKTASCLASPSGITSQISMAGPGEEELMSFAVDSPVRTLVAPGKEQELMASKVDCGAILGESFARWGPGSCSWKIRQLWLLVDLEESLEIWPRWGLMQDGECWELPTPMGTVKESESGYLPRPQRVDGPKWYVISQQSTMKRILDGRQLQLIHIVGLTAYTHLNKWWANPPFWEAMMDWPIGWTDLRPLGMDKFQAWLRSHGEH